jgi:hypothetical protein
MEGSVVFPVIVACINDNALHRCLKVRAWSAGNFSPIVPGDDDFAAVGIQQYLFGIETGSVCRVRWSEGSVGIDLSRLRFWYENMPIVVGAVYIWIERYDASRARVVLRVEE